MKIKLQPSVERFVKSRIARGDYRSADELINTAISVFESSELTDTIAVNRLRKKVRVGLEQLDRGEVVHFSAKDIMREGRRVLASRRRSK